MLWVLIALFVIVAIAAFVLVSLKRTQATPDIDEPWPYYKKKVLSDPEQMLYHRLVAALPECIVLAQVQLSRVLGVNKGANFPSWNNRISQKSLDFVVCLKDSSVVAVIELDDSTHALSSRKTADATKDKALKSAGIEIIRWNVKSPPDEVTIRAAFVT